MKELGFCNVARVRTFSVKLIWYQVCIIRILNVLVTFSQCKLKSAKINFMGYITWSVNPNYIVTCWGLAWLIIMGSGVDDWIYWHFFTVTLTYDSSRIELSLTNLSEESLTDLSLNLRLPWLHEWTPFYNGHAARIEITASEVSTMVLHECVVSEILCLATCYLATTRSLLFVVTETSLC
jgi:hypothetical protein